jgi:hypothetical protein
MLTAAGGAGVGVGAVVGLGAVVGVAVGASFGPQAVSKGKAINVKINEPIISFFSIFPPCFFPPCLC